MKKSLSSSGSRPLMFQALGLAILTLSLAGCGGNPTTTVTGKVTLDGKMLAAGTVTFVNEQQKSVQSSIISKDGSYSVNIAAGACKITVAVPPTGDMPEGMKMDPSKMGAAGKVATQGVEVLDVPAKYKNVKTTPLTLTVEAGQKTHDIEMKADAKTDK